MLASPLFGERFAVDCLRQLLEDPGGFLAVAFLPERG
jgi:hypothetical protein